MNIILDLKLKIFYKRCLPQFGYTFTKCCGILTLTWTIDLLKINPAWLSVCGKEKIVNYISTLWYRALIFHIVIAYDKTFLSVAKRFVNKLLHIRHVYHFNSMAQVFNISHEYCQWQCLFNNTKWCSLLTLTFSLFIKNLDNVCPKYIYANYLSFIRLYILLGHCLWQGICGYTKGWPNDLDLDF